MVTIDHWFVMKGNFLHWYFLKADSLLRDLLVTGIPQFLK
jgi:hypothetical protein